MILVDTSVWVEHLRRGEPVLATRLLTYEVLGHPLVAGELAMGNLAARATILRDLDRLPQAKVATPEEVRLLVERRRLYGLGLGWVDACLLAATLISPGARLWTRDRRLAEAAAALGVAADVAG